ncbi:hypothetical protein [Vibrio sonorensis]|uniref:hypothetical protein n=1 Tax=Vibrio sonorensis TaxID=1004316 RepID=UPI0008DA072A|nr:hypothetical protein [Vibrio sonorensis]
MKPLKLCSLALILPALVACVAPNQEVPHLTHSDSAEFSTDWKNLPNVLDKLTAPIFRREEKGVIHISLEGGLLSQEAKQKIQSDLSTDLLMPVSLEHTPSIEKAILGRIDVIFVPQTCRYNQSNLPVTRQACQQLRNKYLSTTNKLTWHYGTTYQESNSALSTGAVQRLYNNQIKSAEKQSVTGED